eukprot:5325122-Ditylum_brightwellii.AAC.1
MTCNWMDKGRQHPQSDCIPLTGGTHPRRQGSKINDYHTPVAVNCKGNIDQKQLWILKMIKAHTLLDHCAT